MAQVLTGEELIRNYRTGFDLMKIPPASFVYNADNTPGSNHNATQEDVGRIADMNFAGANTFTVLAEANLRYPFIPNQCLYVCCLGAGTTTLVAGAGVTITPIAGTTLVLQTTPAYAMLRYVGSDVWHALGHLVAS